MQNFPRREQRALNSSLCAIPVSSGPPEPTKRSETGEASNPAGTGSAPISVLFDGRSTCPKRQSLQDEGPQLQRLAAHDSKLFRPAIGCRRKEATIRPDERLKACRTLLGTWFEKGVGRTMTTAASTWRCTR